MIEGAEESGSLEFTYYLDKLKPKIGNNIDLCVVLDSGCGNYNTFWLTTNLRGCIKTKLKVEILKEGVHSGDGSGIIPDSFRIIRKLLSRIENDETGEVN